MDSISKSLSRFISFYQVSPIRNIVWSVGLFVASFFWLYANDWGAEDIIWSFWSASLLTGYSLILSAIVANFISMTILDDEAKNSVFMYIIALLFSLFLLAFFSVHFLGFHLIHAVFLEGFFPLSSGSTSSRGSFLIGVKNLSMCVEAYPLFLLILTANKLPEIVTLFTRVAAGSNAIDIIMTTPYRAVITIHLTIFVLAISQFWGVTGPVIVVFIIFYFLPGIGVVKSAVVELRAIR